MIKKFGSAISVLFTIVWASVLVLDYIDKHPYHVESFLQFKFFNLLLFLQLLGVALFAIVQFLNVERIKSKFFTGISAILLIGIVCCGILYSFDNFVGHETTFSNILYFLSRFFSLFGALIILFASVFVIGDKALNLFFKEIGTHSLSLKLAIGSMILISVLFCLASINLLTFYPVLFLILIPILGAYKSSLQYFKKVLFSPYKGYNTITYWGFLLFYIFIIALSINFLAILSPYPYGFDARNYYLNVTQLISISGGHISGFQPYSWQLLMSTGFVLLKSHELAILISFSSFVLAIVALFEFMIKVMKFNINIRFLVICILICTPAIYNQLSIDVKIDFALLFFQIVIFHLFFNYIDKAQSLKYLVLISLLSGFALSIKFTHLYLMATLIIVYWSRLGKEIGMLSATTIGIGVFLFAHIDDVSGLRSSHLGVEYQQLIILLIGFALLAYLFLINRTVAIKLIKFSIIFAAFNVLPILPWAVKNYIETKSLSPRTLLLGKAPGVNTNFKEMNETYQNLQK